MLGTGESWRSSVGPVDEPRTNDAQAAYWESRAAGWMDAETISSSIVGDPFGDVAIERLAPAGGQRLLDVGCGTGPTTQQIARIVAPDGTVTGADIAPAMVVVAAERARAAGVDNATFVVADAQTADLGRDAYDAAFSRFGVMFFSDPVAAFANIRAALRPGGRVVFACWQELLRNEWMFVPGAAAIAASGQPPNMPEPGAPGPFSLCEPQRVRTVLGDAGFSGVELDDVRREVVVSEAGMDGFVQGLSRMGAVREQLELFADDPAMRERILEAVRDELSRRLDGGELRLTSAAWVVSALA